MYVKVLWVRYNTNHVIFSTIPLGSTILCSKVGKYDQFHMIKFSIGVYIHANMYLQYDLLTSLKL